MHQEIIKNIKPELDKAIAFAEKELAKIRGSRPSISLIEEIEVDYYGKRTVLRQLATLTLSGPRTITVQPWDKSALLAIEKAVLSSNLGINPVVDKDVVRLPFPQMSEEYRKELTKLISSKAEDAKATIRHWREEAWRRIQEGFRQKTIREDDKFRARDELQKIVDEYNQKIDSLAKRKTEEIAI